MGVDRRTGCLLYTSLRPARYTITKNDMMVVASEVGVMDFDPTEIAEKGRLQPGKILLIDTQEGKIYYDGEIKERLAAQHPYRQWLNTNRIELEKLRSGRKAVSYTHLIVCFKMKRIMCNLLSFCSVF